jgi:hypothetical protein
MTSWLSTSSWSVMQVCGVDAGFSRGVVQVPAHLLEPIDVWDKIGPQTCQGTQDEDAARGAAVSLRPGSVVAQVYQIVLVIETCDHGEDWHHVARRPGESRDNVFDGEVQHMGSGKFVPQGRKWVVLLLANTTFSCVAGLSVSCCCTWLYLVCIRRPCHHRELSGIWKRSNVRLDNC